MERSKPQVVIDLAEYNELLKIKEDSRIPEDQRELLNALAKACLAPQHSQIEHIPTGKRMINSVNGYTFKISHDVRSISPNFDVDYIKG